MGDLFNYDTSWLHPALKLINVVLFLFVGFVFWRARFHFAGDICKVLRLLAWMGLVAAVASYLRYLGHGETLGLGFDSRFSLKWFQSLGYVAQAILFLIAAIMLNKNIIPEIRERLSK